MPAERSPRLARRSSRRRFCSETMTGFHLEELSAAAVFLFGPSVDIINQNNSLTDNFCLYPGNLNTTRLNLSTDATNKKNKIFARINRVIKSPRWFGWTLDSLIYSI